MKSTLLAVGLVGLLIQALPVRAGERSIPAPDPGHPGNVFLEDERVQVPLPAGGGADWRLLDDEGREVRRGTAEAGEARPGRLPVGWYELTTEGNGGGTKRSVSLAVLARLRAPTPRSSPIALDVAMAWFYPTNRMSDAAKLCALAGVNWVRDRLSWPEMEPRPGEFAGPNRYDASAARQSAAGLQPLQVIHVSPAWANTNTARFPADLRDAFRFYRAMAQRWSGQLRAFEPWNEADIRDFGGHTGAEIASLQKAAYFGLKAGDSRLLVCQNVFAINRSATLEEFAANAPAPYFETMNLHHYIAFDAYPAWYAAFRAIASGRPLWVTECAMPVKWSGDPELKEPAAADLRVQSERVAKVFAGALHEGAEQVFYFLLPHYAEGQTQFGIVRADLTPRPAYVALAAAGRLLADARPRGRIEPGDPGVRAYLFDARPDGQRRTVLVAWTTNQSARLELPVAPAAAFNLLGQPLVVNGRALELTSAPRFAILPAAASLRGLAITPPPVPNHDRPGKPCPIVLQLRSTAAEVDFDKSVRWVREGEAQVLPVRVYNFSGRAARIQLRLLEAPADWAVELPSTLSLAGDVDADLPVRISPSAGAGQVGMQRIRVEADAGRLGRAVLAVNLRPKAR